MSPCHSQEDIEQDSSTEDFSQDTSSDEEDTLSYVERYVDEAIEELVGVFRDVKKEVPDRSLVQSWLDMALSRLMSLKTPPPHGSQ